MAPSSPASRKGAATPQLTPAHSSPRTPPASHSSGSPRQPDPPPPPAHGPSLSAASAHGPILPILPILSAASPRLSPDVEFREIVRELHDAATPSARFRSPESNATSQVNNTLNSNKNKTVPSNAHGRATFKRTYRHDNNQFDEGGLHNEKTHCLNGLIPFEPFAIVVNSICIVSAPSVPDAPTPLHPPT